jgi:hypothetical protein
MSSLLSSFRNRLYRSRNSQGQSQTDDAIVLRFLNGEERVVSLGGSSKSCKICGFGPFDTLPAYKYVPMGKQKKKGYFSPTYEAVVETSSKKGELSCASCTLLRDCINIFHPDNTEKARKVSILSNYLLINGKSVEIFALSGQEYLPFGVWPRGVPSTDTSSRVAEAWAKRRLSVCAANHPHCGGRLDAVLPDRIIDIGINETSNIRLLENFGNPVRGVYVALSHCWGGKIPECRTTSATLRARKTEILFEDLPKTFRDAVTFSRVIQIRYLWIDSICIIQDDKNDWEIQAAKMSDVYGQAFFTIAAAYSPNCDSGLFSVMSEQHQMTKICSIKQGNQECDLFARAIPEFVHWWNYSPYEIFAKNPPLFQRAWTYQERLLSRRVLWFTPHELQWECMEAVACECCSSDDFFDTDITHFPIHTDKVPDFLKIRHRKSLEDHVNLFEWWSAIVVQYCALKLTKESDKLPAIAGLAAEIGERRPHSRYLAGLWSDSIETDLLWCISNSGTYKPFDHAPQPLSFRAPSWSWAAVGGIFRFNNIYKESLAVTGSVKECRCEYKNNNVYGEVLCGYLKATSKLYTCQVDFTDGVWWLKSERSNKNLIWDLYADYNWHEQHPINGSIKPNAEVFLLEWAKDKHWVYLFVMIRYGREENQFRRIGLVQYNHSQVRDAGSQAKFEEDSFSSSCVAEVTII